MFDVTLLLPIFNLFSRITGETRMKRYISFLLAVLMLVSLVPASALADSEVSSMKASEELKTLIKYWEGVRLTAYKAHSSEEYWTIGYGHYGPDVYEGMEITAEQADAYFEQDIAVFEAAANRIIANYGLEASQNVFDAMLSLSYNFGPSWVETYAGSWRLARYVKAGFKDSSGNAIPAPEIADAFAVLCSAGGEILPGLLKRRLNEAEIFLYGDYSTAFTNFVAVIFDANGGTLSSGNRVIAYEKGKPYGSLPTAALSGTKFGGWKDASTGSTITSSSIADQIRTLTAVWGEHMCPLGDNCPSKNFADVPASYWAHSDIDNVVSLGLFNGTSTTRFGVNDLMTRSMLLAVLYRLDGSPDVSGYENRFSDVDESKYYYNALLWGSHNNISNGYSDGTFLPDGTLTREQFVTFLNRYANYKGYNTEVYADIGSYSDAQQVSTFARESMCWAIGAGIVTGTSATTLSPQASATRAQVAVMFNRFAGGMTI